MIIFRLILIYFTVIVNRRIIIIIIEKLDGLTVSALRPANTEVKQRWSVSGWVKKNVLT
jgi:hypothetical protein